MYPQIALDNQPNVIKYNFSEYFKLYGDKRTIAHLTYSIFSVIF